MDESRLELKVGALVLAAVVGAVGLLLLMGEISLGKSASLTVDFAHTGNVVRGAPVKLGGVPVGRVAEIALVPERRDARGSVMPVKMTLSLSKEALLSLRADASVTVNSQGPLGEPYLELNPGQAQGAWPADTALRGTDSPRIDLVSQQLARFLEASSKVLEDDPDALRRLVTGVSGLTHTVDGMLLENKDEVRQIAQELAATAKDLRALSATARAQLEPGGKGARLLDDASAVTAQLKADAPGLSKQAQTALTGIAAVTGSFTPEDGAKLKAALARYAAAGEKLDSLAGRADRILARLEACDGTLGAAMKDKQVYDDLKGLLSDLRAHPWKVFWKD